MNRRPIDGRRFQAQIEVPRNRVISIHAVLAHHHLLRRQAGRLIARQGRVLRAICCMQIRLINYLR